MAGPSRFGLGLGLAELLAVQDLGVTEPLQVVSLFAHVARPAQDVENGARLGVPAAASQFQAAQHFFLAHAEHGDLVPAGAEGVPVDHFADALEADGEPAHG